MDLFDLFGLFLKTHQLSKFLMASIKIIFVIDESDDYFVQN